MSNDRTSSGGTVTSATHGMWGKPGKGLPELAKGSKASK